MYFSCTKAFHHLWALVVVMVFAVLLTWVWSFAVLTVSLSLSLVVRVLVAVKHITIMSACILPGECGGNVLCASHHPR